MNQWAESTASRIVAEDLMMRRHGATADPMELLAKIVAANQALGGLDLRGDN